jgi:hypothetical protein
MENIEPDFVVDITGFTDKKIEYISLWFLSFMIRILKNLSLRLPLKNFQVNYRSQDQGRSRGRIMQKVLL